ncbi:beta-galactosidase [Pseudomonas vanderleydeniana]|uniref:Cellulase family glycosylhydrolase n=1 Tax=Pseudomonas vanderleydeniana TaxID=2745495 RepID=A0A9E6PSL6_9PSED|nr:beta-galactosidase [Pseudomonas vanderleydeniana]QXI31433.1 cellulase family glycosylhydrolase [Pseudomonas vanderleydeniana]
MWRKPILWVPLLVILAGALSALQWRDTDAQSSSQVLLKAPRAIEWKDFLGVNAQFQYFDPGIYQKQMSQLDQLGLNWVRLTIHWPMIEPQQGTYDVAALDAAMQQMKAHNYNVIAYLVGSPPFASSAPADASNTDQYPPRDFNLFANRMATLAERYPQVNTWQVWNEPNIIWLPKEDPTAYYQLLTATAKAIRDKVPGKPVATAGLAYYSQMHSTPGLMLDSLVSQGLASQNIIAAYHPYSELPEGDSATARDFLSKAGSLNRSLHGAGVSQVWATEWGWSSYAGPKEMQALIGTGGQQDYTLRRLALMSAMDYQRIFLFNLSDLDTRATPRDQFYGLLDLDGEPKPVYTALKNFLEVTGPKLQPADTPSLSNAPDDLFSVTWTRNDGARVWMFWSATGSSLQLPGVTQAALYDPLAGSRTDLSDAKAVTVPLKTSLQLLVWSP